MLESLIGLFGIGAEHDDAAADECLFIAKWLQVHDDDDDDDELFDPLVLTIRHGNLSLC